ncbi:MAG: SAM-dependent chlorinase/fluorinase [Candidatus Lokiarchaeota archaeon]|nr:SAM-dependent chlorinase/fluorinase [Candidatus Lokiarchaeota archaeon]
MADFNQKLICLLTDFGSDGQHYVASMKAIILKINFNIKIIDISHHITPYSIIEASYVLKTTYKYFPEGTVFIIVVDPEVGGFREILAFKIESNYYFIGPNNGIFSDTFTNNITECVEIQNDEFFQKPISNTFHGRDIMAPVGAHLLSGIPLNRFGPKFNLNNLKLSPIIYDINIKKKTINCVIQCIDSFGNGTTNIPIINSKVQNSELLLSEDMKINVNIRGDSFEGIFTSHFSRVLIKSIIFLVGSTGFLEISLNQGNASKELGFNVGDIITVKL